MVGCWCGPFIHSQYRFPLNSFFFFFNDTATTEIYTLSLHDALPICGEGVSCGHVLLARPEESEGCSRLARSEEHTSELQSRLHLVCRLLLEKKKKNIDNLGDVEYYTRREVMIWDDNMSSRSHGLSCV